MTELGDAATIVQVDLSIFLIVQVKGYSLWTFQDSRKRGLLIQNYVNQIKNLVSLWLLLSTEENLIEPFCNNTFKAKFTNIEWTEDFNKKWISSIPNFIGDSLSLQSLISVSSCDEKQISCKNWRGTGNKSGRLQFDSMILENVTSSITKVITIVKKTTRFYKFKLQNSLFWVRFS